MEVRVEGDRGKLSTYRYTVTIRMATALRLMCSDESHFNVILIVTDHKLKRKESRSGIEHLTGRPNRLTCVKRFVQCCFTSTGTIRMLGVWEL